MKYTKDTPEITKLNMRKKLKKRIIVFSIIIAIVVGIIVIIILKTEKSHNRKQPEKNEVQELEEDWGKIHPDFRTNPELVNSWKRNGFDYTSCLGFTAFGIKPWEREL